MKKHLLKSFAVAMAMLGASAVSAAIPENLYMCGGATSVNWDAGNAVEFTKTTEGVFTYEGTLFADDLILMTEKGWEGTRFAPETDKTKLEETNAALSEIKGGPHFENHWTVKSTGTWKLTVVFNEEGDNVMVAAKKQPTPIPEHLYMTGPATPVRDWNDVNAVEFTKTAEGVFTYEGDMYTGELIIMNAANWNATYYGPMNANTNIEEAATSAGAVESGNFRRDNHWKIKEDCKWKLTVTFTDTDVEIAAKKQIVPENLYMAGASVPVSGWNIDQATPMNKITNADGSVEFNYKGVLYGGTLRFVDGPVWNTNMEYGPGVNGWWLNQAYKEENPVAKADCDQNNFYIADDSNGNNGPGRWTVRVVFQSDGSKYRIYADRENLPENMYIVGDASPSRRNVENALQMKNEGNGVFTYHGNLYALDLHFIDQRSNDGVRYYPEVDGWGFKDAATATIRYKVENKTVGEKDYCPNFRINPSSNVGEGAGTYDVKVTFSGEDYGTVKIEATRVGELSPELYAMGAATNQWDVENASYKVTPEAGKENVFVWEGTLDPNAECKHFKFISYPCSEYWNTWFYVPAECDFNGNVKLVEVGQTYPVRKTWGNSESLHEHYWGFAAEKCTSDKKYKMTFDMAAMTINFEENGETGVSEVADAALKAGFVGDELVVNGAASAIVVYDIAGRVVASSNTGSLTAAGLPNGVYVVKTAEAVVKVAK